MKPTRRLRCRAGNYSHLLAIILDRFINVFQSAEKFENIVLCLGSRLSKSNEFVFRLCAIYLEKLICAATFRAYNPKVNSITLFIGSIFFTSREEKGSYECLPDLLH